jgi:organic radical activating enzyme
LADRLRALDLFVQPQDPIDDRKVQVSYLHGEGYRMDVGQSQYAANLKRCIDFVKTHPDWRLGLQTHKFANLP